MTSSDKAIFVSSYFRADNGDHGRDHWCRVSNPVPFPRGTPGKNPLLLCKLDTSELPPSWLPTKFTDFY